MLAAALFAANVAINLPLFQDGAQPYRGSIESGYAGIARFFAQHPNPWGWNPLIYCGLPAQHSYLPGAPYLVALLLWARPEMEPLHAYRIVVAIFACLGPVTLFLFSWYSTRSKWWALAAAIGYSLCSPSYDLFQTIDQDRGLLPIPWRLHVMLKYGEGPHNMGLTLLPLALMGVMAASSGRGFATILAAAVGLAAVALTHWIASLALAICCVLFLLTHAGRVRVLAAAGLAYLLACFWLTPTFVRTVGFNWPKDAFGYQFLGNQRIALLLIAAGTLLGWWLFHKHAGNRYLALVTLCFFVFAALAEGHYAHGVDAIPESRRYAIEMELFLALALAEWMRLGWSSASGVNRFSVLLSCLLLASSGIPQAKRFLTAGYSQWTLRPKEQTVEYQIARWLAERTPAGRVHVSGGLRFRLNSWFNLAQTNGTFDSGVRNRTPLNFDYRFRSMIGLRPGEQTSDSVRLLQAMGVEYLVVHGGSSQEYYRDVKNPRRFENVLEKVYDGGEDVVYRVPFTSLVHLVSEDELPRWWDPLSLASHPFWIAGAPRPRLETAWEGPSRLRISGRIPQGMRILILMSFEKGWRVRMLGREVDAAADALGNTLLKPEASESAEIVLEYRPGWEKLGMAGFSVMAWVASAGWLVLGLTRWRRGNPVTPSGV